MCICSEGSDGEQNVRVGDDVQRESRAQMRELRAGLESELSCSSCERGRQFTASFFPGDNRNYEDVSAKTLLEKLRKQNEIYESTGSSSIFLSRITTRKVDVMDCSPRSQEH